MEVLDTVEAALKVNVQNIVYEAACALGDDAVCFIPTFGNWGRTNPIEKETIYGKCGLVRHIVIRKKTVLRVWDVRSYQKIGNSSAIKHVNKIIRAENEQNTDIREDEEMKKYQEATKEKERAGVKASVKARVKAPRLLKVIAVSLTVMGFALVMWFPSVQAQSLLDRTPNLQNGWIGEDVQFNFNHRMIQTEIAGEQRIIASPTFLLGVPVADRVLVAVQYASSSEVVESNEWELFARWVPLTAGERMPAGAAITAAYNTAAESIDGELSLNLPVSNLEFIGSLRTFSGMYDSDDFRVAVGGGMIVRVSESVAFTGDIITLTNRSDGEEVAWGAGLHLAIPRSPHTFSIQFSNAASTTLQGSTRGEGEVYWGFEFTTPLTFFGM